MINKQFITYHDETTELEAFGAYQSGSKRPLVILCHAWAGKDSFIMHAAERMAELGYVGFALDMYGKNVLGKSKEENIALKSPFIHNRTFLQRRVLKGYEAACSFEYADTSKIVVLGFGFGGMCALDLARTGISLNGVLSVYGHFEPPINEEKKQIKTRILILHGFDDPVTPINQLSLFAKELDSDKVNWQANLYGNSMHAFINPQAHNASHGILYNPVTAQYAWNDIQNFIADVFK